MVAVLDGSGRIVGVEVADFDAAVELIDAVDEGFWLALITQVSSEEHEYPNGQHEEPQVGRVALSSVV